MAFNHETMFRLNLFIFNIGGIMKQIQYFLFKRDILNSVKNNKSLFNNENKGKTCTVCALGPSLKKVNLNRVQGDTIVVNRFYKIGASFPDFVPTYYMMIDQDFTKPEYLKDFKDAITAYANRGTIYILNAKLVGSPILNEIDNKQVFFISCLDGILDPKKNYSIDKSTPIFQNVAAAAIFYSILMGYGTIKLLGCDFNSFAHRTQMHCYKDANDKRLWSLWFELFCYAFASYDHTMISEYAKKHGISITNSSDGSLIDAYEYDIDKTLYN